MMAERHMVVVRDRIRAVMIDRIRSHLRDMLKSAGALTYAETVEDPALIKRAQLLLQGLVDG